MSSRRDEFSAAYPTRPIKMNPTARQMLRALRAEADPSRVPVLQGFFRTQPGGTAKATGFSE